MIEFNGMSTPLQLFYTKRLRNDIYTMTLYIFIFFLNLFLFFLFFNWGMPTIQWNMNNFSTDFFHLYKLGSVFVSWHINWTLTEIITPCQSGPWSNGNEGILYTTQMWNLTIGCIFVSYSGNEKINMENDKGKW